MKPEEEAKLLVNKYMNLLHGVDNNTLFLAKQCALFNVDEQIKLLRRMDCSPFSIARRLRVKNEINNLQL